MSKRWLVVAVVFSYLIMLFGGGALKPGYSHVSQFISELNATGTPYAQTIGWLGFFPFGVLAGALIVAGSERAPVRGASRLGYWLLMAEPIAYIGSAIAPCDLGCPLDGSANQVLHNILGLLTYLATTLGLFLLAFTPNIWIRWRLFWTVLSLLWLTFFSLMMAEPLAEWRGLLQRLAEWIVFGSLCICAWKLLGTSTALKSTAPRAAG